MALEMVLLIKTDGSSVGIKDMQVDGLHCGHVWGVQVSQQFGQQTCACN